MNLRFPVLVFFLGVLCATTPLLSQTGAPTSSQNQGTRPIGPNPQPPEDTLGVTLFAYGPDAGDTAAPRSDDGSTDIAGNGSVLRGFGPEGSTLFMNIGDTIYDRVYVSVNGLVSFGIPPQSANYKPTQFHPNTHSQPILAPYWADANTNPSNNPATPSGNVWYRTTNSASELADISARLNNGPPGTSLFKPTFAQIVTWDKVGPYTGAPQNTQVNTFQLIIASNGVQTYALYLYPKDGIWWDRASSSTALPSVGYYINPNVYHNVPGSGTTAVRDLWFATNFLGYQNIPAELTANFIFRIDGHFIFFEEGPSGGLAPIVVDGSHTATASATTQLRFRANPTGHTVTAATAADSITFGQLRFDDPTDQATFTGQTRALAVFQYAITEGNLTFADDSVLIAYVPNAINGGSLTLANNAKLALYAAEATTAATSLTFTSANATLDLRGFSTTLGTLHSPTAGDGRIINSGANPVTLTLNPSADVNFRGAISNLGGGTLSLVKEGSATQILSGTNTYTGTTTVSGGILQIGDGGASGSLTGSVTVASNARLVFNRADATSLAGVISGAGSLTQVGAGTLTLSGVNTYTGGTTISAGTLQISANPQLGGTTGALTFDGGTLATTASFGSTRHTTLAAGGGTFAPAATTTLTWAGRIGGVGNLTKSDAGTLVLSGVNTHSGGTTISAGTLSVSDDNQLGSLTLSLGALTLNGGTLRTTTGITSARSLSIADATTSTVDVAWNQTSLFSGAVSGGGNLIKTGIGTLTISGPSLHSGNTTLDSGTLIFGSSTNITYGGSLSGPAAFRKSGIGTLTLTGDFSNFTGNATLEGSSNLVFNPSADATYAGSMSGSGSFTKSGATTLTLTGNLAGLVGVIRIAGGRIDFNPAASYTLASVLTGTGVVSKSGDATLTLTGNNTGRTGDTTLADGTLNLGSQFALHASSGTISFTGGTLQFSASNATDYSARFSTLAGQQYRLDTNGRDVTLAAGLTSSGATLTKSGAGTLTLTGTNTFNGTTTIEADTLQIGNGFTTGSLDDTGGIVNHGALVFNRSNDLSYGGIISGTGSLAKQGAGILILTGINTHSGGTTISSGALSVSHDNQLGNTEGTPSSLTFNGGTLLTSTGITSARAVTLAAATTSGFNVSSGQNSALSGAFSGSGHLTKAGAGTLTLAGSSLHSGNTTISAGTLSLNPSASLTYAGAISGAGAFTKSGATTLTLTGNLSSLTGATTISGGRIDFNPATSYTLSSAINGSGAITKSGTSTLTLTGNNASRTGSTTLAGGTLNLGSAGALNPSSGTISFTGGTLQFSANNSTDYSGRFSATAGQQYRLDTNGRDVTLATGLTSSGATLTKSGAGTLTLTGLNTFTGTTTIEAGTLRIGGDSSSLNSTGGIVNQGTLVYARTGNVSYNGVISGVGSLVKEAAGTLNLTGNLGDHTFTGGLTLNAGSLNLGNSGNILADILPVTVNAGTFKLGTANETIGSLAGTGGIVELFNGSGRTLTVGGNVTSTAFAGVIQGTGGSLTKTGSGTQILAGANTYTGSTTITGGTLQIGNGGTSGSLASNSILNNAALVFNRSDTSTYTGVISGSGSLTKNGAGTLTLTGASTFTGATNITAGRVNLTGSAVNSTFVLSGGGLLSGTGRVGGLTIDAGGIVSPGNSSGTLFVDGASTFGIGGSMTWELNATAFAGGAAGSSTGWDLLSISGALNIAAMSEAGNTFTIRLVSLNGMNAGAASGFDGTADYVFDFVTAGSISGFSADKFTIDASAFQNLHAGTWSIGESGGSLLLSYAASASPIPEPSTYAAFVGVAALGLAAWRRRDRKSPPE